MQTSLLVQFRICNNPVTEKIMVVFFPKVNQLILWKWNELEIFSFWSEWKSLHGKKFQPSGNRFTLQSASFHVCFASFTSITRFTVSTMFTYIPKADVLDVRTPQKIQTFRRKIDWKRENYQSQSLKAKIFAMCYK